MSDQMPEFMATTPSQLYALAISYVTKDRVEAGDEAHAFAAHVVDAHLERDEDTGGYCVWSGLDFRRCWDHWLERIA